MPRKSTFIASAIAALALSTAALAQAHEPPAPAMPGSIEWSPAPPVLPEGAQIAVHSGNPGAEGPFVLRLKLPGGYAVPAHTHSGDELITVISGEFNVGHGEKLDRSATMVLSAGGFIEMPAGHPHFAWTGSETIVQIHGPGPFDIQYIDPSDDPLSQ
jgi:quercetin dioxygenase-like cupin family protein